MYNSHTHTHSLSPHTHAYTHTYTHACMDTHTHTLSLSPHTHAYTHTYTHACMDTHTLSLSHVHTHTHTHHTQEAKCSDHNQEVGKLKEEIGSLNIKVKWAQNKLKSETEAHRVSGLVVSGTGLTFSNLDHCYTPMLKMLCGKDLVRDLSPKLMVLSSKITTSTTENLHGSKSDDWKFGMLSN